MNHNFPPLGILTDSHQPNDALAVGGVLDVYGKPQTLNAVYGNAPLGYTLFTKLELG